MNRISVLAICLTVILTGVSGCAATTSMKQLTPNNGPIMKLQRIEGTRTYYAKFVTESTDWKVGGASLKELTEIICNPAEKRTEMEGDLLADDPKGKLQHIVRRREGLDDKQENYVCESRVTTNYDGPSGGTEIVRWVVPAATIAGGYVGAAAVLRPPTYRNREVTNVENGNDINQQQKQGQGQQQKQKAHGEGGGGGSGGAGGAGGSGGNSAGATSYGSVVEFQPKIDIENQPKFVNEVDVKAIGKGSAEVEIDNGGGKGGGHGGGHSGGGYKSSGFSTVWEEN